MLQTEGKLCCFREGGVVSITNHKRLHLVITPYSYISMKDMKIEMELCQDFTFRFWVHELQGQLHSDITAETRSHRVRTPAAIRSWKLMDFMFDPHSPCCQAPQKAVESMDNIFFIVVREAFQWQQENLLDTHPPPATIRLILIL